MSRTIVIVCCLDVPRRLLDLSHQKVGLVFEDIGLDLGQWVEGLLALATRLFKSFRAQSQACQQQVTENRFSLERRSLKEFKSIQAEAPRFKKAALVVKHQGLIKVDQVRPDVVLFPKKHSPGLSKAFQRAERLILLAERNGEVGKRFGALIAHFELLELRKCPLGGLGCFFTEVQFQVDFREVEVTEGVMVGIAHFFADLASGPQHFDAPVVFSPEIEQISDVVVRLRNGERHIVFLAKGACALVSGKSSVEIIKTDEANRDVMQGSCNSFEVLVGQQALQRALVAGERLGKTVLTVENVSNIDLQARQSQGFSAALEDLSCPIRSSIAALIVSQQDERLNRRAECAPYLQVRILLLEQSNGLFK